MRPTFDTSTFRAALEADVSKAYELISNLEQWELFGYSDDEPPSEEHEATEMELRDTIERVHERLAIAFEYLELPLALERLSKRFQARETNLAELKRVPYVDVLYSPALSELAMTYESIAACVGGAKPDRKDDLTVQRGRQLLRQVLVGTPKLIADRNVAPKTEAEVRREIYGVLLHVFPDTVRELPIPQVSKTYRPDIGVPHLGAAVEYKFCDSAEELKRALGGIYEDTKGYAGSKDWTFFFAVLYCTDVFMTEPQLREELGRIGMPESWEVILVTGRGGRAPRAAATAST